MELSVPQHMQALARAERIRLARAKTRREVRDGRTDPAEVIRSPSEELAGMSVSQLLSAQHRWGQVRTERFLRVLRIPELRELCRLTDRQRDLIERELGEYRRLGGYRWNEQRVAA